MQLMINRSCFSLTVYFIESFTRAPFVQDLNLNLCKPALLYQLLNAINKAGCKFRLSVGKMASHRCTREEQPPSLLEEEAEHDWQLCAS